jgi:hypothetical protein
MIQDIWQLQPEIRSRNGKPNPAARLTCTESTCDPTEGRSKKVSNFGLILRRKEAAGREKRRKNKQNEAKFQSGAEEPN